MYRTIDTCIKAIFSAYLVADIRLIFVTAIQYIHLFDLYMSQYTSKMYLIRLLKSYFQLCRDKGYNIFASSYHSDIAILIIIGSQNSINEQDEYLDQQVC